MSGIAWLRWPQQRLTGEQDCDFMLKGEVMVPRVLSWHGEGEKP